MAKEKLICSAPGGVRYAGKRVKFWQPFEASRKDARILIAIGKAVSDPGVAPPIGVDAAPRTVTPVEAAAYTPPEVLADDLLAAPKFDAAPAEEPKISARTGRPVRRYARRDIKPE